MSCIQITACWPDFNLTQIPDKLPSVPCTCPAYVYRRPGTSLRLSTKASNYQQSTPVCLFGGKGKSENGNEASPWKALENVVKNLKKEPSVEDLLRQQIEKQEFYEDDGGSSGGNRPGGGDGDSGGTDDEGLTGILDELLQVILATLGFIFLYIYIIDGEELTRLAKDYIKYLFGARKSVRLRRAMYEWGKFYKRLTKKKVVQKNWLERAIINTPTWYDNPVKYRRVLRAYLQSSSYQ